MKIDQKKLFDNIKKGRPVEIKFFENNQSVNSLIESVIISLLEKYNRQSLSDVINGCIKELVINAIKANVKKALFKKNNLDINDMGQYVLGITRFKTIIENYDYKKYNDDLIAMELWVKLVVNHNKDGIIFEVFNNSSIVEIEDRKIRMKLQKSIIYDDLKKYYAFEREGIEGEDAGVAMVLMLMEKANLDPGLFRMGTINDITVSRIELPLSMNYRPKRHRKIKQ